MFKIFKKKPKVPEISQRYAKNEEKRKEYINIRSAEYFSEETEGIFAAESSISIRRIGLFSFAAHIFVLLLQKACQKHNNGLYLTQSAVFSAPSEKQQQSNDKEVNNAKTFMG